MNLRAGLAIAAAVIVPAAVVAGLVLTSPEPAPTLRQVIDVWATDYDPTATTAAVRVIGNPVHLSPGRLCFRAELTRTWPDITATGNYISAKSREPLDLVLENRQVTASTPAASPLPRCIAPKTKADTHE